MPKDFPEQIEVTSMGFPDTISETSPIVDTHEGYGWVAAPVARRLERERDAERALADRLHGALDALDYNLAFAGNTLIGGLRERVTAMRAIALPALAAWKESRQDRNHS